MSESLNQSYNKMSEPIKHAIKCLNQSQLVGSNC